MSTTSGRTACSARTRLRAEPGPWWRMPKKCSEDIRLELVAAGAVEIFPAVAFLDHGLQVFAPDHRVLHRVLDDCADQPRRHVVRLQTTVAEVTRQRHAVGDDADGLGRRQRAARRLELRLAVLGLALAQ